VALTHAQWRLLCRETFLFVHRAVLHNKGVMKNRLLKRIEDAIFRANPAYELLPADR
jgi:hypothetical protein